MNKVAKKRKLARNVVKAIYQENYCHKTNKLNLVLEEG